MMITTVMSNIVQLRWRSTSKLVLRVVLYAENGPYVLTKNGTVEEREHAWDVTSNIIFVDRCSSEPERFAFRQLLLDDVSSRFPRRYVSQTLLLAKC